MKWPLKLVRRYLTGIDRNYRLTGCSEPVYAENEAGLYIHIPFCKSLCPYCPYNKIPYEENVVREYGRALLNEIELVGGLLPEGFKATSLYIGGGTPTLCMDILEQAIEKLNVKLNLTGDICVETGPNACDQEVVKRLRAIGVTMVSVGIQSFDESLLRFLGRNYKREELEVVISRLLKAGFDSVNCDFMFAMPGQSEGQLESDLRDAVDLGAEQITVYPLFCFPYSSVQNYRQSRCVKTPALRQRKRQFELIGRFFVERGFERSSIWSFRKAGTPKYSSATRQRYIGLGAGAGSCVEQGFFLNTFDVNAYIQRLKRDEFPTALAMEFTREMHQYFWLYWRLYDTFVTKELLWKVFDRDDAKLKRLLWVLRKIGWMEETPELYRLKDKGAFWVHLIQNGFLLQYINKVWTEGRREAFPREIQL